MLSENEPFDPTLYTLEKAACAKRASNITKEQAIAYLMSIGAHISFPEATPRPDSP
jgi:hypothetical protein